MQQKQPRQAFKKKEGPTEVDVYVGQRLRHRRLIMGLTQESLANSTGLTFQQIQKYEQGKNRVSASRLLQFGKILTVEPNFFFSALLESQTKQPSHGLAEDQDEFRSPSLLESKETIELLRAYYSISDLKKRKGILKIIKEFADTHEK